MKLHELGGNRNSRHRNEVKHDSVNFYKFAFEREFSMNVNSPTYHFLLLYSQYYSKLCTSGNTNLSILNRYVLILVSLDWKSKQQRSSNMPFSPGEVVLKSKPFVYCISKQWRPGICDYCLNSPMFFETEGPKEMIPCFAGCQCVYFCQQSCQEKAWEEYHGQECQLLSRFTNPNEIDEGIRMAARTLIKLRNGSDEIYEKLPNGRKVYFNDLVSHRQSMTENDYFGHFSHFGQSAGEYSAEVHIMIDLTLKVML